MLSTASDRSQPGSDASTRCSMVRTVSCASNENIKSDLIMTRRALLSNTALISIALVGEWEVMPTGMGTHCWHKLSVPFCEILFMVWTNNQDKWQPRTESWWYTLTLPQPADIWHHQREVRIWSAHIINIQSSEAKTPYNSFIVLCGDLTNFLIHETFKDNPKTLHHA